MSNENPGGNAADETQYLKIAGFIVAGLFVIAPFVLILNGRVDAATTVYEIHPKAGLLFTVLTIVDVVGLLVLFAWSRRKRKALKAEAALSPEERAKRLLEGPREALNAVWASIGLSRSLERVEQRRVGLKKVNETVTETVYPVSLVDASSTSAGAAIESTPLGFVFPLHLPAGMTRQDVESQSARMASLFRAVAVQVFDGARLRFADPSVLAIEVCYKAPLAGVDVSGVGQDVEDLDPLDLLLGLDENGQEFRVDLSSGSLLLGGMTGSGKSSCMKRFLRGLSTHEGFWTTFIDLKGQEASQWKEMAPDAVAPIWVVTDVDPALAQLRNVVRNLEQRIENFNAHGIQNFRTYFLTLTPEQRKSAPMIFVVIDEVAQLFESDGSKESKLRVEESASLLRKIVQQGRSAGVFVIAAGQKMTSASMPTNIRSEFAQRMSFFTNDPEADKAVLLDAITSSTRAPYLHQVPGRLTVSQPDGTYLMVQVPEWRSLQSATVGNPGLISFVPLPSPNESTDSN